MRYNSLFILLLCLAACGHPLRQLIKTGNGYFSLPPKDYVLDKNFTLPGNSKLSTDHVYTCCPCRGNSGGFLSFLSNGQVISGSTYKFENGKIDTTYSGGYYSLTDSILKIELPGGETSGLNSTYSSMVYTAILRDDKIMVTKAQWNGKGPTDKHMMKIKDKTGCDYRKASKAPVYNLPDW